MDSTTKTGSTAQQIRDWVAKQDERNAEADKAWREQGQQADGGSNAGWGIR
jgi:hypothetical protein